MAKPIWFPLYANDFLASNKVSLMTTEEIGAYFLLLCRAWMDEKCRLPSDDVSLKQMGRFTGDLTRVRACFFEKNGFLYNERLYAEWKKSQDIAALRSEAGKKGMGKRWHNTSYNGVITNTITNTITKHNQSQSQSQKKEEEAPSHPKRGATRAAIPDTMWIDSLKENPLYRGIDIDVELRKCTAWCETRRLTLSRKRLTNWLIKAMDGKPLQTSLVSLRPVKVVL